ncbi:DUF5675 family protein [Ulvibacter litoralis]|uniref:DUF5675 domain-containing protein n=1 Tax=Ulvibacter litoralis TaxID=227084 RepID=A0A1G7JBS6_9FLAO|nr:DUF5675 family protein [Ulvibacter litoralis]GHC64499.1 hypothetical protein GCM10008083_32140 [Ulvibacter litoralis]SDF22355.1 hypothetical protein SAMN05421855_11027 [Ulvibacter litoralis]
MELVLTRLYKKEGTIGTLTLNGHFICFTVELPWHKKQKNRSCIPEGSYELKARYSQRFKNHLHLQYVKGKSLILMIPASNVKTEIQGCIVPVQQLTGIGKGIYTKLALDKVLSIFHQASEKNEKVVLTINSNQNEDYR